MKRLVFFLLAVILAGLLGGCTQAPKEPDRLEMKALSLKPSACRHFLS